MILAVLAGVLLALSMPGMPIHILVWFSMIPLFETLASSKPISGGLKGFLFFSTAFAISHFWILDTITRNFPKFAGFTPFQGFLVFLLLIAYQGAFYFPFGFFGALLSKKNPYLVYPALYALTEIARQSGQMGFTGARLSDAVFNEPHIVALSSLVGELGISMIIIAVNVILWKFIRRRNYCCILILILLIYIPWHLLPDGIRTPYEPNSVTVYLYQTNEEPEAKYGQSLKTRLAGLPKVNGLLITPEAYIVSFLKKPPSIDYPVLLGALYSSGTNRYNSAFLINDGSSQRYDKVKLFPFVEFLPYPKIFGVLGFLRGFAYYTPGNGYHVLDYNGKQIGVLICFESYFDDSEAIYSRKADFIVVVTNDVWFRYRVALWNHFAKDVFRAAETGRWVIQVANKGITGAIDPWGRIRAVLKVGRAAVRKINVGKPHPTLYPKIKNYFVVVPITLLIFGIFSESQEISRLKSPIYSSRRRRPFP